MIIVFEEKQTLGTFSVHQWHPSSSQIVSNCQPSTS
jgi:hypothetical protein